MGGMAAVLVDDVFPIVTVRQSVLSILFALRYRKSYDSGLLSDVLNVFSRSRLWRTSPPRPGTLGVEVVAMRGRDVRAALRRCVESRATLSQLGHPRSLRCRRERPT